MKINLYMKKIATITASISMVVFTFLPGTVAASSLELNVTGNGADSTNTTAVTTQNNTVVSQNNNANITNNISANSSSGNNSASKNTGGDVSVDTGNSKTLVSVENTANTNTADVKSCACDTDAIVSVSGNGADSTNNAALALKNSTTVAQTNNGNITNKVYADSNSGDNKANKNTGGDVSVSTGNALTNVELSTEANSNWASVGGHGNGGSNVSLLVLGNGADSNNSIGLALENETLLQQKNQASIKNWVDADATTGDNKAYKNTGGETSVDTGDAWAGVAVDNAANFNWASVDCDCLTDVTAKIANNGADTKNTIGASLLDGTNVYQDNSCETPEIWGFDWTWKWNHGCGIDNSLHADADTGSNSIKESTGYNGVDPEVSTGNSQSLVGVENTGNSNVYGSLPEHSVNVGGVNINLSFDLSDLLNALGLH